MKNLTTLTYTRTCDVCKSGMNEGFYVGGLTDEYFCQKKCLHNKYTEKEYKEIYEDDIAFWTTWDPEDNN